MVQLEDSERSARRLRRADGVPQANGSIGDVAHDVIISCGCSPVKTQNIGGWHD